MNIREELARRVLIFDGGMGTMLQAAGLPAGREPELWNLERPEAVKDVHRRYLSAGADIVTTNTFGANAVKLAGHPVEEIVAAAKAVNAHDFIMRLEKGYDTELSERGGGLSIGQKQLLAFARTMVSDPAILILDEATSSIDTKTELLVQEGIEHLLKGRTSFVIAHRLSTIQKADRIFVIDGGTIVEEGNAAQLMEKKGAYYKLYMSQFKNVM